MPTNEEIAERYSKQWHGEADYEWRIKGLTNIILSAINQATGELQKRVDRLEELLIRWTEIANECSPEAGKAISQMMEKMGVPAPLVPVDEQQNRPASSHEDDPQGDNEEE